MSPLRPTALAAAAVLGALMPSPCSAGTGAYETALKKAFTQILLTKSDYHPISLEVADKAAECQAAYVVRGLSPQETQMLDTAVSERPQVSDDIQLSPRHPEDTQAMNDLMRKVRQRLDDMRTSGLCQPRMFE